MRIHAVKHWSDSPDRSVFIGEHQGYMRLKKPLTHRRKIEWLKQEKKFTVTDYFIMEENTNSINFPKMTFTLMLHPECNVHLKDPKHAILQQGGSNISITTSQGEWSLQKAFYSPAYGVKLNTTKLVFEMNPGIAENQMTLHWGDENDWKK